MGGLAEEHRRSAMFYKESHDYSEVVGGLAMVALGAAIVPILSWATATGLAAIKPSYEAAVEVPPPPVEVIETRFVRLGTELDPRKLPDKYIASKATAPPAPVAPEPAAAPVAEPTPAPPTPVIEPPQPGGRAERKPTKSAEVPTEATPAMSAAAAEDLITRLGDSADAIAELAKPRLREGDPQGIPEGTETAATGDLYLGQLYTYFRRGWSVPTSIPDKELDSLSCVVEVTITADARVGGFRIVRPSGSGDFDTSVRRRMDQTVGASLPEPPAETAARYLGRTVSLRFLGKHGR